MYIFAQIANFIFRGFKINVEDIKRSKKMQVYGLQNNNIGFNAQLKVNGQNLPKKFHARVEKIVKEIGGDNDVISVKMGHQYDKEDFKTLANDFHTYRFSRHFRDISIKSVIDGEEFNYSKTIEVFPNTGDAIGGVKTDIMDYLKLLKKLYNKS